MMITTTGIYWRQTRFLPPSPNPTAAKGRRRAKRHVNRRERRIVRQGLLQVIIGTLDGAGDLPGID
jgi:hypothetical protein